MSTLAGEGGKGSSTFGQGWETSFSGNVMPQAASAPVAGSVMEQHLSGLLAGGPSPTNGPESIVTSSGTRVPVMDLVNQVAAQASVPGNSGPQRIVLQLNPQDLGPVTLHVSVRKERVHARIEAGSEQVLEVLGRHLPRLQSAMADQNVAFAGMQLSLGSGEEQGQNQGQGFERNPSFAGGQDPEVLGEKMGDDELLTSGRPDSGRTENSGLSVRV